MLGGFQAELVGFHVMSIDLRIERLQQLIFCLGSFSVGVQTLHSLKLSLPPGATLPGEECQSDQVLASLSILGAHANASKSSLSPPVEQPDYGFGVPTT